MSSKNPNTIFISDSLTLAIELAQQVVEVATKPEVKICNITITPSPISSPDISRVVCVDVALNISNIKLIQGKPPHAELLLHLMRDNSNHQWTIELDRGHSLQIELVQGMIEYFVVTWSLDNNSDSLVVNVSRDQRDGLIHATDQAKQHEFLSKLLTS